jgi:hypothetical protein
MKVETSTCPVGFQGKAASRARFGQSGRVVGGKHEGTFFCMVTVERIGEKPSRVFFQTTPITNLKVTGTKEAEVQ